MTNLQQQLSSQQQAIQQLSTMLENQQASLAGRENALQAHLSDMLERWNRDAANVEALPEVEPDHGAPRRHKAFIESRAFSKLANFDSKAASWKDWAFKFENMAAAMVPSSRDSLDWAAQQDTPILNVDGVEARSRFNPQVYVALAELLEGEALDIVQNTTRGASLEAWRKLVRRFDPQTVGRKRTLLSRIINPGKMNVHESRAIEHWEECVRSYQSRARENFLTCVSGILTEMCPEHIKTLIHLNPTSLPDYASVRSEIETFLEARQSSSNPDATDIGSLNGQKGVCRNCRQRSHWAASCPKRGKSGGKDDDGKGQGKKCKLSKGKNDDGKGKGKDGKWQARKALMGTTITVGNGDTWKRIVTPNPRARVAKENVQAVLMNLRKMDQRTLQLADLVCAHFETIVMTGSGIIVAK